MAEDPGFLLVQAGLVRDDQLLTAREARAQGGGTLGEHLVMAGAVDDDTLTEFYARKLVIPRVETDDLAHIPTRVLRRIPADMAAEFRVVPVASDGELNLTLAMSDPADQHSVDEVAFFTGASVVRAVATQLQIAWCLAHYYGIMTPLARARLLDGGKSSRKVDSAVAAALAAAEPLSPEALEGGLPGPLFSSATPWEVEDEEETGPSRMPIARRRTVQRRGSELAPRSGTLDAMPDPPPEPARLPAVVVDEDELTGLREFARAAAGSSDDRTENNDDDDDAGAEAHAGGEREPANGREARPGAMRPATEPILLDRPRARGPNRSSNGASLDLATGSGEILLLEQLKERRRAPARHTEPGLGQLGSVDSRARPGHDTGAPARGGPWAENQGENDTVRRQSKTDRRSQKSRAQPTTDGGEAGPEPNAPHDTIPISAAAGSPDAGREGGDRNHDGAQGGSDADSEDASESTTDPGEVPTNPMRRMSEGTGSGGPSNTSNAADEWNVDDGWDIDDGWGPPGTTIPGEYLGARPDSRDGDDSGVTPVQRAPSAGDAAGARVDGNARMDAAAGMDAAALAAASAAAAAALAAVPTPLGASGSAPAVVLDESALGPAELAAELEKSSNRLLETLRALERAPGRDEIVDILLDHMGASMRRRAFFAVKGGVLFAFRQYGAARPGVGTAELSLEPPSTFAQVAINRIAYRGTLSPAAVEFVAHALGSAGKGDAIVVPVEVRGRPVGLLYGDGLSAIVIEEHQTVLGRAAGQAFERILSKRAARESGQPS